MTHIAQAILIVGVIGIGAALVIFGHDTGWLLIVGMVWAILLGAFSND